MALRFQVHDKLYLGSKLMCPLPGGDMAGGSQVTQGLDYSPLGLQRSLLQLARLRHEQRISQQGLCLVEGIAAFLNSL